MFLFFKPFSAFHFYTLLSMGESHANILFFILFFSVPEKKERNTGLEQHKGE